MTPDTEFPEFQYRSDVLRSVDQFRRGILTVDEFDAKLTNMAFEFVHKMEQDAAANL